MAQWRRSVNGWRPRGVYSGGERLKGEGGDSLSVEHAELRTQDAQNSMHMHMHMHMHAQAQ